MIKSPSLNKTTTTKPPKSTAFLLLFTIVDATLRFSIPPIGLAFVGIYLDVRFNLLPILTVIFMTVGFVASCSLIKIQIKRMR